MSYGYDTSNITDAERRVRRHISSTSISRLTVRTTLQGIRTSKVSRRYSYNTVDHPITPTRGKSLFISTTFAGSVLGGNVNMIEPTIDAKYFRAGFQKGHVIGVHVLGRFVTGYGGRVAPPFNRFYMGGENDVRGFEIWGISPIAYVPSEARCRC